MKRKNNIYELAEMESDWAEASSIVQIKLWDKSIILVRTHFTGNLKIPLETIWAMFNLDVKKETVRLCKYPLAITGLTWVKTNHINSLPPTLFMDLDAIPYYLSTVPTEGMAEEAVQIITYISEVARGKLADYFRLGKNNLDRRFEYLQGTEKYLFDVDNLDRKCKKGPDDDNDAIPF